MLSHRSDTTCPQLIALMRAVPDDDRADEAAQAIAEHVATCPLCTAAESGLVALIAHYREEEDPPLPEDIERRLLDLILDHLCGQNEPERM